MLGLWVVEVDVLYSHVQVAAHTDGLPPRNSLPSISATSAVSAVTAVSAGLGAQGGAEAGIPSVGRVDTVGVPLQLGTCVRRVHVDQAQPVGCVTTPHRAARQRQPPCERAPLLPSLVSLVDDQRHACRKREACAPPCRGHACVALARRRAGPVHLPLGRALVTATIAAQQREQLRLDRGHVTLLQLGLLQQG